jgi:hypothetical protein
MSNTQRPTLAKKHTTASESKRDKMLDDSFGIRIDGIDYVLTPADLTGVQELRIRRETGYSVTTLIQELQTAPGVDLIAMFMWACSLSQGKSADLEQILGSVSYASDVEIMDEPQPDNSPEA